MVWHQMKETGNKRECTVCGAVQHNNGASWTLIPDCPGPETVIEEIRAERRRQVEAEGWSEKHDDEHSRGEMALAAACYASPKRVFVSDQMAGRGYEAYTQYFDAWPWADEWWKPKDRRRDLVRAGALIVAEIERLDRLG